MKDIYILGAGGFAREVFYLVKDINEYRVKAFVDVTAEPPIEVDKQMIEVVSEEEFDLICQREMVNVAIAIANNCVVKKIAAKYSRQCLFPNLIHPSVIRFGELKMGQGNIVAVGNFFSEKIVVEKLLYLENSTYFCSRKLSTSPSLCPPNISSLLSATGSPKASRSTR